MWKPTGAGEAGWPQESWAALWREAEGILRQQTDGSGNKQEGRPKLTPFPRKAATEEEGNCRQQAVHMYFCPHPVFSFAL